MCIQGAADRRPFGPGSQLSLSSILSSQVAIGSDPLWISDMAVGEFPVMDLMKTHSDKLVDLQLYG
jgi:hypothetical protein